MRYRAADRLEIVRLVEQLPLLPHLGETRHPRGDLLPLVRPLQPWWTGPLNDRSLRPGRVCNGIPDGVGDNVIQLVLDQLALSPPTNEGRPTSPTWT
jgi:hypothetical protein